jgi:hypothetical protein
MRVMQVTLLDVRLAVIAATMLATAACSPGDVVELVSPGDGFVRLLAADADSFYFTRRTDSLGVLYRGDPAGGPHAPLAEDVGAWLGGAGVVYGGFLYFSDGGDNVVYRVPTGGGGVERVVEGLDAVSELAAADGTVYIGHLAGYSAYDVETGQVTPAVFAGGLVRDGLAVAAGHLVWAANSVLVAAAVPATDEPYVVHDRFTECPEEEACSFQALEVIGARDGEILFIELTFSRYDTGKRWSNGDPRWDVRIDGGALHALAFGADGAVSVRLVEDDVVMAAERDGALFGVRRGGAVVGIDPVQDLGLSIAVEGELLSDSKYHPRLLATRTHLVFPSTDGSIYGVALR